MRPGREIDEEVLAFLGIERVRTLVGLTALAGIATMVLIGALAPRLILFGGGNVRLGAPIDVVIGVAIFLALLANMIGPLYGLWNGGPGLAALFPIVPPAIGMAISSQPTIDIDVGLALACATAAAVAGSTRATYESRSASNQIQATAATRGLAIGGFFAGFGLVILWRLQEGIGTHVETQLLITWGILVVAIIAHGGLFVSLTLQDSAHKPSENSESR